MVKLKRSTPKLSQNTPSLKRAGTKLPTSPRRASLADDKPQPAAEGQHEKIHTEDLAEEELNEVLSGFKKRASREVDRFVDATDSEFWVALCFQNRDQKEEFLEKIGLDVELDGDKYLDGMAVARALGIELETEVPPTPTLRLDAKMLGISLPIGGEEE